MNDRLILINVIGLVCGMILVSVGLLAGDHRVLGAGAVFMVVAATVQYGYEEWVLGHS